MNTSINWIVAAALLATCWGYALQGAWTLNAPSDTVLGNTPSPTIFQFYQQIEQEQIKGYATVVACRVLVYHYQIEGRQIFMEFVTVGRTIRDCLPGQLTSIRLHIDQTFYFSIRSHQLYLETANQVPPFQLNRLEGVNSPPALNGVWVISDGVLVHTLQERVVILNQTTMGLCRGDTLLRYSLDDSQRASVTGSTQSNCNSILVSLLPNIRLYRVNPILDEDKVSFYDQDTQLIMELTRKQPYSQNLFINFSRIDQQILEQKSAPPVEESLFFDPNNVVNLSIFDSVPPFIQQPVTEPVRSALPEQQRPQRPQIQPSQPVKTSISNQNPIEKSAKQPQTVQQLVSNEDQAISQPQSPESTASQPPSSEITQQTAVQQPSSQSSMPQVKPPTSQTQPPPQRSSPQAEPFTLNQYLLLNSKSELQGRWYPLQGQQSAEVRAVPSQLYQIIINPARIFIRGGCNTMFSSYGLTNSSLTQLQVSSTNKVCPHNGDQIIKDLVFSTEHKWYGRDLGNSKELAVVSGQGQPLLRLTSIAPA